MASPVEDYALIGDCQTAALVSRTGSIDWLCLPHFDSKACFAALLGTPEHGHWSLGPAGVPRAVRRRYRGDTLVLETDYETDDGAVTVIDCMPPRSEVPDLVRVVVGRRGRVAMRTELVIRFDYGSTVPWVTHTGSVLRAIAGPDLLRVESGVRLHGEDFRSIAEFTVAEGQRVPFVATWFPSYQSEPAMIDADDAIITTEQFWSEWSARSTFTGPWRDAVMRSLITLKALTFRPSGGIVAAPTTSLPEEIGGVRNWDYRFCWLRDATFTLYALMMAGYREEARAWREWLIRAVAGEPSKLQIMYGIAGERRLPEMELPWLPGSEASRPVRIGNAAHDQFQLDVYGELMDAMHQARRAGLKSDENGWRLQCAVLDYLESAWQRPDEGLWEVRGPSRHFTHSKVMAWVAMDRAVKAVERFGLPGPADRWRALRAMIHQQVCREGYDVSINSFVQSYGARELDASLLMVPLVGFLPASDPRVVGTVAAIERELLVDGFVKRYINEPRVDGLPGGEGSFLACSFWLADNYALMGRTQEAVDLFERLLAVSNDVGLLAEEYDPRLKRMLGNFPQAFSHVALINTANNLCKPVGPALDREHS